jgi:Zn-dependent peptidase ImmA (M78 family)
MSRPDLIRSEDKALDTLLEVFKDEKAFDIPINIIKVAEKLGLSLKEGMLREDAIGSYDKNSKTISISKNYSYPQTVFTIAHEIGHFVLHNDRDTEVFFRKDLINVDKEDVPQEQEANCFAAALLMPKGTILRYFEKTKDIDILYRMFGVSPSSMRLRIKNLGLTSE